MTFRSWLAHRHGSVTIPEKVFRFCVKLWLAHRHGSVTISPTKVQYYGYVVCTQARVSYNKRVRIRSEVSVVACTQARVSYNYALTHSGATYVVACTQARVSYNLKNL